MKCVPRRYACARWRGRNSSRFSDRVRPASRSGHERARGRCRRVLRLAGVPRAGLGCAAGLFLEPHRAFAGGVHVAVADGLAGFGVDRVARLRGRGGDDCRIALRKLFVELAGSGAAARSGSQVASARDPVLAHGSRRDPNSQLEQQFVGNALFAPQHILPGILRIGSRSAIGIGGRPARDLIRQSSLQPARCQRIIVAGCTTTSAPRQSKRLASSARLTRVAASTRCGRTPRSTYRASCRRRKRFSARRASADRNRSNSHRKASSMRRLAIFRRSTMRSCCHSDRPRASSYRRPSGMEYLRSTAIGGTCAPVGQSNFGDRRSTALISV
jgi:hypothetical protein